MLDMRRYIFDGCDISNASNISSLIEIVTNWKRTGLRPNHEPTPSAALGETLGVPLQSLKLSSHSGLTITHFGTSSGRQESLGSIRAIRAIRHIWSDTLQHGQIGALPSWVNSPLCLLDLDVCVSVLMITNHLLRTATHPFSYPS